MQVLLDTHQKQAVQFKEDSHLLVLAGAGSGKTKVIIERTRYLLKQGVDSSKIAIMTFTKKAATEIQERISDVNDTKQDFIFAGTFHAFALEMINQYSYFKKYKNRRIIDRDDQVWLAQICLQELNLNEELANTLISSISYAKNILMPVQAYIKKFYPNKNDHKSIFEACKLYEAKKQSGGYLDYDDLIVLFLDIIKTNKEARDKICSKYEYLLVDEMQDTNPLQWSILEQYAKYLKLFCVGDDAQSIYAFRGADFKNIHSFTKRLHPSKIIKLTNNYRSTQEILKLSNALLKRSPYNYDKKLRSMRGTGKKPIIYDFNCANEEAKFVANYIQKKKDAKPYDFMVLVRSAFNAKELEKEFLMRKILYVFIGGQNLMQSEHIKDALCVLQIAYGYTDELVVHRFIRIAKSFLSGKAKLYSRYLLYKDEDKVLKHLKKKFEETSELYQALIKIREMKTQPSKAVHIVIVLLRRYLKVKYQKRYKTVSEELAFLKKIASKYNHTKSFLQGYILNAAYKNDDKKDECIKISTIHSAKGTEAKYCILLQANNDVYPHKRSKGDIEKMEEERRILYVAMTRAKDELIITRTNSAPRGRRQDGYEEYFLGK